MMTLLYFRLPFVAKYEGKKYKINPYFDVVLKVFSIQKEKALTDYDKLELSLDLLVNGKKPNSISAKVGLLNTIFDVLIDNAKGNSNEEPYFDFLQDSGYIYSSFVLDYGIDLYAEQGKLHWLKFIQLFQGLSEKTKIMQVMQIRAKPLPTPTKHNTEERINLMKQKAKYALILTQEEREKRLVCGLNKLADLMGKMASTEVK